MLSWLQVKLNVFIRSLACSLFMHAVALLTLLFCGSYTQLKHTHLYTSSSKALSSAKQFTAVRLGKVPRSTHTTHTTHTPYTNVSNVSNVSKVSELQTQVKQAADTLSTQVQADTKINTSMVQESKPQEHVQKQVQKTVGQANKKNAVQNKKTMPATKSAGKTTSTTKQTNKHSAKQAPVAGQFSPLKKEHTKLLRSKERQKSRVQTNKEPVKKQAEKQPVISASENTPAVQHSEPVTHKAQDKVHDKAENISVHTVQERTKDYVQEHDTDTHTQVSVQVTNSVDQSSQLGQLDQLNQVVYTPSAAFERPELIKAYERITDKIQASYSKPPGFDSSLSFTLTFKIAHVTGKPHDISPRPDHVPLLVYQSAKASITETVYPQELWGTEPEILFY